MAVVFGCELPEDLWFHVERDVWMALLDDGTVRIGMTDPAQTRAGKILTVRVRVGRHVDAAKSLATVESGKWVGPVPAPIPGTVTEANPAVAADPSLINRDPYGAGWLLRLSPDVPPDRWESFGILRGKAAWAAYRAKLKADSLSCTRCADAVAEGTDPAREGS
jgi:glycine cleavage system H protein